MRQLDILLTDLALPIRLYECRTKFKGHSGSFETNLTGIRVRLHGDKGQNLEFEPASSLMNVLGEKMHMTIYAFKTGRANTYRSSEGVLFTVNGQTHGNLLRKNFFGRKKVNMGYLKDSLLVIIDCSDISERSREKITMPSRDRLRDNDLKFAIEGELTDIYPNTLGFRN